MRKPEEIFDDFCLPSNEDLRRVEYDVCLLIKRAQIEAIEETVKKCAENACGLHCTDYVDKQSILQVADKLKKELE